jgi:glycosyltransferase involved in cell wall biosynthesis
MDVARFDPDRCDARAVRERLGIPPDALVVGTIARLFRKKGYEQLIPIMAKLASDPRLHFLWIGDGAQRSHYQTELRRRGLDRRTTLAGLARPDEIPELLAACDLLAHTSQWEGLPRVVVQALLMRVPVVAFAIDGTPEVVVENETGHLVALNDSDRFVDAVLNLVGDPRARSRMGVVGRDRCLAMFEARLMVERLERIYHDVAPTPSTSPSADSS